MGVFDSLKGKIPPITANSKPWEDELSPFELAGVEEDEVVEPDGDDRDVEAYRDGDDS